MTEATRLARTSVLILLLLGVLSPVPTSAAVLFDNSKADKVWDITLPTSTPLLGDTNGHYINFFKGFLSLGNPSPILGPDNAWVTTATTTTARIKKAGNYTCDSLTSGTAGFSVNGPTYNINNAGYFPTDSTPPVSVGTDYCDFHFAGAGIPTGTPLSVAFFGTAAPHAIAGSDSNSGTSFDGFYGNPIPGGFAFQLCDIDGCSGGFSTTTTPTTTPSGPSSVLFLPGIESSRLYRPDYNGGEDKLWEPNIDADVQDLYLGSGGTGGRSDIYTKEKDVIDTDPTGHDIYKPFLTKMDGLKSVGTIADWEPIAYDWRLSLDEILSSGHDINGRIYYTGDLAGTTTPYVIQELRKLASTSKSGKVTIVAHSNGGLVAKRLTEILGPTEASKLIDKIILVAVPQVGTPMAIGAGLHGYGQELGRGYVESKNSARTFASTSPMFYNLLPSQGYFTQVDNSVIYFDPSTSEWITRYGGVVHSQDRLDTFLTDSYRRSDPQTGNVNQPTQLDAGLLTQANALHTHLDTWTPPIGVDLIQIAGWGLPTMSGITYKQSSPESQTSISPDIVTTIDGDGTVVTPSALWTSASVAKNYWVDLKTYNDQRFINTTLGLFPFDHSRILATIPVNNYISDLISSTTKPLADYQYLSNTVPTTNTTSLRFALHSPLTLSLYDNQGRHAGISTSTGQIEEEIPDTYYMELGDVKYIFTDTSNPTHIQMSGYATSTFTFNVDQLQGDILTASTTFKDIPVTPSTQVNLDVVSDISTLSPMHIDLGDGVVHSITPKPGDIATLDLTPPEITLAFSTSTNSLVSTATDDSGKATLTSATAYPTLKKNQTGTVTTTLTATDPSGNSTILIYTFKYPTKDRRVVITPVSISYNGKIVKLSSTSLKYKWNLATDGSYKMFASYIQTTSTSTESHFRPKKKVTIIMTKPADIDDGDEDDDADARKIRQKVAGLVLPYIKTSNGKIITNY